MTSHINSDKPLINIAAYELDRVLWEEQQAIFQELPEVRKTNQVKRALESAEQEGMNKRFKNPHMVSHKKYTQYKQCANLLALEHMKNFVVQAKQRGAFKHVETLVLIRYLQIHNQNERLGNKSTLWQEYTQAQKELNV